MNKIFGKPDLTWIVSAVIACALLASSALVPLWKMELVAPQYPEGLVMKAFGYKFVDDPGSRYDDVREINGLNHYIGMKPIEEVFEMQMFLPGLAALIVGTLVLSFVKWRRTWVRGVLIAGFWFIPLFFLADLQAWLYYYGHTMDPEAALNTGDFTPKVIGTTKVWNFHSENSVDIGFWLMVMAALVITFVPLSVRLFRRLRAASPSNRRAETAGRAASVGSMSGAR